HRATRRHDRPDGSADRPEEGRAQHQIRKDWARYRLEAKETARLVRVRQKRHDGADDRDDERPVRDDRERPAGLGERDAPGDERVDDGDKQRESHGPLESMTEHWFESSECKSVLDGTRVSNMRSDRTLLSS